MNLEVIILAAGQGTRMKSNIPKVLHSLAGKPMLEHVIDTAQKLDAANIHIVYGHGGDQVKTHLNDHQLIWAEQEEQLGTGHAVQQAMSSIDNESVALILYGDVPLIQKETLQRLIETVSDQQMALLTVILKNPTGYGRIVRGKDSQIEKIVEHKDASDNELAINEVNTGIMAVRSVDLHKWLNRLDNNNVQREYYLTDIIEMAVTDNVTVVGISTDDEIEVTGINDKVQLQMMERAFQLRQAEKLMREGATIIDAARIDLRGSCTIGKDVTFDVNVVLEGNNTLGNHVSIGPNVYLKDATIGDHASILANSVIDQAVVGKNSKVGPFARLRPDTVLAEHTHIGNFVEIKKSIVGNGSKVNHLSYIGDAEIGKGVNIGAGTITCNYDGANKFKTIVGDYAFIGSDSQLVAPVVIGAGATIGAGSTITKDTEDNKLTLSRSKQLSIDGWKRPQKKK